MRKNHFTGLKGLVTLFLLLQRTHLARVYKEKRMLKEHGAYHHEITGKEAERRLKKHGGHCYLTRHSESLDCYVLSIFKKQKSIPPTKKHYKITIKDDGRIAIEGKERDFADIEELLQYYQANPIDPALSSIGCEYTEAEYNNSTCTLL